MACSADKKEDVGVESNRGRERQEERKREGGRDGGGWFGRAKVSGVAVGWTARPGFSPFRRLPEAFSPQQIKEVHFGNQSRFYPYSTE